MEEIKFEDRSSTINCSNSEKALAVISIILLAESFKCSTLAGISSGMAVSCLFSPSYVTRFGGIGMEKGTNITIKNNPKKEKKNKTRMKNKYIFSKFTAGNTWAIIPKLRKPHFFV